MSGIDEKGASPMRGNALVLLSGGMDSTACLHWTLAKYASVRAIGFDYGQPHRDAELYAAHSLAVRRGVPFERVILADCLHSGLLASVPAHEVGMSGPHKAFVPMRNMVFLSVAMARATLYWPTGDIAVVFGPCLEDASGFPDCGQPFIRDMGKAARSGSGREISICAPYSKMPKAGIIADVRGRFESGLEDLQASWSCYAGKGPCGTCTPCVLRRDAFAAAGLDDLCVPPVMHGGDVDRDARLRG